MVPFNRPIPQSKQQSKRSSGVKSLADAEKLMQIAILLPSSAFVGWVAGAWLDSHLHQTWMSLAGILFGGFSGLAYVVRLAMAGTNRPTSSAVDQSRTDGTGSKL
jgi:F0F1-type ATP synthase assembly protein I